MSDGNEKSSHRGRDARRLPIATAVAKDQGSNARLFAIIGLTVVAVGAGIGGALLTKDDTPTPKARTTVAPAQAAQQLGAVGESCPKPARHVSALGYNRGREALSQTEQMIVAEAEVTDNFARHVRCIINNDRARFCSRDGRAALVEAVNEYVKMRRLAIRRVQQMGAAIMSNPAHQAAEATYAGLNSRLAESRRPTAMPALEALQDVDSGVISDVQSLITEGYITPGHFGAFLGLFMPEELGRHIEGLDVTGKACG